MFLVLRTLNSSFRTQTRLHTNAAHDTGTGLSQTRSVKRSAPAAVRRAPGRRNRSPKRLKIPANTLSDIRCRLAERIHVESLKTALVARGSPSPRLPLLRVPRQSSVALRARSVSSQFRHAQLVHEASPLAASTTSHIRVLRSRLRCCMHPISLCSALGSDVEAAGDRDMLRARR